MIYFNDKERYPKSVKQRGFTLIEMMVAVSLFAVVMTISMGALLSIISANKKAQAMQSVVNNLKIALDGMVRSARMGTTYHCGTVSDTTFSVLAQRRSCTLVGGTLFSFERFKGNPSDTSDQSVYWVENKRLFRSKDSRQSKLAVTAPEIQIDSFKVYVTGATYTLNANGDTKQPKVVFSITGTASAAGNKTSVIGAKKKTRSSFSIQAVATQRILDL